jgi:hypothetical protein
MRGKENEKQEEKGCCGGKYSELFHLELNSKWVVASSGARLVGWLFRPPGASLSGC